MSIEVAIWRIDNDFNRIPLSGLDYEQRLQEAVATDSSIVEPGLLVIGQEVPTPVGSRIDILAVDAGGNLVVIELKRDRTPRDVVAQALDYGSMVRQMTSEEIAELFIDYQRDFLSETDPQGIDDALRDKFNSVPAELNSSHRLVIVAGELDPPTERIVRYLREDYGVDINVVFFRAFEDEGRHYMTRAWLAEPDLLPAATPTRAASREWNREFYVTFGDDDYRDWNDAKEYGFVSAGGGEWYIRTLRMLQPGNRVWVHVPGRGFVGVGIVRSPVVRYDQFMVDSGGSDVLIADVELEVPYARYEEIEEHFVSVDWIKTVEFDEAVWERGFFANTNIVAKPRNPKWDFTVQRLKALWEIVDEG
ncbi:MAG: endonuclease NucS [Chloroflexi bacterium]|nr:endonuclease NucS [Chloroflexota bacterium]